MELHCVADNFATTNWTSQADNNCNCNTSTQTNVQVNQLQRTFSFVVSFILLVFLWLLFLLHRLTFSIHFSFTAASLLLGIIVTNSLLSRSNYFIVGCFNWILNTHFFCLLLFVRMGEKKKKSKFLFLCVRKSNTIQNAIAKGKKKHAQVFFFLLLIIFLFGLSLGCSAIKFNCYSIV